MASAVIAVAAAAGLTAVAIAFIWQAGGLRTEGRYLDWEVVSSVAAVATAVVAVAALGTLGYGLHQLNLSRRAERLSLMPFLRVDIGFEEARGRSRHFFPPQPARMFDARDFGEKVDGAGLDAIAPKPGRDSLTLCVWVTNQQRAELGTAYRINIHILVGWADRTGTSSSSGDDVEVAMVHAEFTYVEPGKITGIRLAPVRPEISWLAASVVSVSYYGLYEDQVMNSRHGALEMYYTPEGGAINERSAALREANRSRLRSALAPRSWWFHSGGEND